MNVPVFSRKLEPGKSTWAKCEVAFSKMSCTTSSSSERSAASTWCTFGSVCAMSSPNVYIARTLPFTAPSNISGIMSPRSFLMETPHLASNAARVASSAIGLYIVR